jgi:DNA topoisomerase-1
MHDLFVIEAPGKAQQLEELLRKIGIDARVQATKGHLYSMPAGLQPLGIDSAFREFGRALINPDIGARIREEASAAGAVYVATDADQEGDVIAWDVAELLQDIVPNPLRVRLRGMDFDSIREAIDGATSVSKSDAVPGRTRAIVDRMIGSVFSNGGVPVGRIQSALLGVVRDEQPVTERLRLVAPSKDGGRPWTAECDVKAPLDSKSAKALLAVRFPALDKASGEQSQPSAPGHTGDIMVRAGDELDMSPKEASLSLQKLYEAGEMSYPRAGSRGMSKAVMRKLARVFRSAGYTFDEDRPPEKKADDVHDAPYPIGAVQVQHDPRKAGSDAGLRILVARDLVKTGMTHLVETGVGAVAAAHLRKMKFSEDVSSFVGKLDWRREIGPRYPGQEAWPKSRIIERRADTVLLESAVAKGLGRPSTWANHVTKFMERGLVDDTLSLTSKGRAWISKTPPMLLNPQIAAAIEAACDRTVAGMMEDPDREPWEILSERIVSVLPPEVSRPLLSSVASEPPHPKPDPLAPFEEKIDRSAELEDTIGLDEILERKREYNYGPAMYEMPQ